MKWVLFACLVLCLYACLHRSDSKPDLLPKKADSLLATSDTFHTAHIDLHPSLQRDIGLDTVEIAPTKKHTGIFIVTPILSRTQYPWINSHLNKFVSDKKKEFYNIVADE